jgi:hypothetical protein
MSNLEIVKPKLVKSLQKKKQLHVHVLKYHKPNQNLFISQITEMQKLVLRKKLTRKK